MEAEKEEKGVQGEMKRPIVDIENMDLDKLLKLQMAIITARLATIQSHIQEKNNDLAGVMTQISRLQMQGDEIERKMGTKKKDYKHLIQVYKQGLTIVQALLRQAMI